MHLTWPPKKVFFPQMTYLSGCENFIDSHACSQNLQSCKLDTSAWVVELAYLHIADNVKACWVAMVRHVAL